MLQNLLIAKEETTPAPRFLGDLPCYQYNVESAAPLEEIISQLQQHSELPGVLIHQDGSFLGMLSRLKILEWLGRPFGIELFFKKPIQTLYANLNLASEIYPSQMRIEEAAQKALNRPPQIRYEPVAVAFSEADLRLLDMHDLLLAQSRRLANANQMIEKQVEIGKILSSTLELPKVLATILEQMDLIIPYSRTAILLYKNNEMEFAVARGFPEEVDMAQARIMVNASRIFKNVIESRQATTVEDASVRDDWQHIPGTPPTRSWLGVPLIHADEVLGMLSISRLMIAPFMPDEVETAQLFASQASIALGNAHLYAQVKQFNLELERRVDERTQALQQAYRKLELFDRNKSDFIKIASHELKTPITVIRGYAQMLRDLPAADSTQPELVKGILNGMNRLHEIVNTMLDVARLDSQEMRLHFSEMELYALFLGLQLNLEKELAERKINFSIQNLPGLPKMNGDVEALYKAFYHLVINAIKYTPDGGRVTIVGHTPAVCDGKIMDNFIQISIADTGIGIDPKDQALIFDKFYQTGQLMLHSSGKTKFKGGGSGLGLSVARGIIKAHGGQIWVESPGHDETTCPGSVFHVILPANCNDSILSAQV